MTDTNDKAARIRALSTADSFIVQAPAGSGKTELLIQRCLALLGIVESPEEVLAITFTRKAAGEMRERIFLALDEAETGTAAGDDHKQTTRQLASNVLARNEEKGWQLLESPSRLRVMTIDALNALLGSRLPLLSRTGGVVRVSDDPGSLYREAARRTLRTAGDDSLEGRAAYRLLQHLDNDFLNAERMLTALLARRDHWLSLVVGQKVHEEDTSRSVLEKSIRNQVELALERISAQLGTAPTTGLVTLASYAAGELASQNAESPLLACRDLSTLPDSNADSLPAWRGLAELLLTKANGWRKSLNKNCGFPPSGKSEKEQMAALLDSLRDQDGLRGAIAEIRRLPDPAYSDTQWQTLGALFSLLPYSAAELEATFRSRGETDYVAISQAAHAAMGEVDDPGDLALAMDYRLQHILVDEFQDTSRSQVALLEKLIAGWEPGDGRTLFCVGDPMQSIYGFREADVGLYLKARRTGIGGVDLEPLHLMANFRSDEGLVEWSNRTFADVLPAVEDSRAGAVPFARAEPVIAAGAKPPVSIRTVISDSADDEGQLLLQAILAIRETDPLATIAVLVRARSHLGSIAPLLRQKGLAYQAVEIEKLDETPVVQDLMALTKALSHPADRVAWLAVLRAPFCGLVLADILLLAGDRERTLWEVICDDPGPTGLSVDAVGRLARLRGVLTAALAEKGRRRLHRWVEGAWLALGGAAVCDETALEDARSFFSLLSRMDAGGDLEDVAALEQQLDSLFAAPDAGAGPELQLMTIHKAKGLQFDHVMLPGLHRGVRRGARNLLHWLEPLRDEEGVDILLAAAAEKGADPDPLQDYLAYLEGQRQDLELGRLLYVAATRACHQLHLFSCLKPGWVEGESVPSSGSFLALLWPGMAIELRAGLIDNPATMEPSLEVEPGPVVRRISGDWILPPLRSEIAVPRVTAPQAGADESIEFDWAGRSRRAVGIVVHRLLQRMASDGLENWDECGVVGQESIIRNLLNEAGVLADESDLSCLQVKNALVNTLLDERGRWILSSRHTEASSELPLAGIIDNQAIHVILDRTFIDEHGTRWIIDFKTSTHAGSDLQGFLDHEEKRYRAQLGRYAQLMTSLRPEQPVRVALYYPMLREWREWDPAESYQEG